MKQLAEYILEALKKGMKVKMRNAIEGHRGKEFDAVVLCDEFTIPMMFDSAESYTFIRLKNAPSYIPGDVQLATLYDGEWSFDPTFWECVGDNMKYFEKYLNQAGLKAVWNDKGYYKVVSK